MQLQHPKRDVEHEVEALGHVARTGVRREGVVTEVGALEDAADDFAEVEYADDGVVGGAADEIADMGSHHRIPIREPAEAAHESSRSVPAWLADAPTSGASFRLALTAARNADASVARGARRYTFPPRRRIVAARPGDRATLSGARQPLTSISSTSNSSVALGGMTPPAPRSP